MLYDYAIVVWLLSHVWLFVILCSLLGSSVLGIIKVRVLQCIVISFSRGSSGSRGWTRVSCLVEGFFTTEAAQEEKWSCSVVRDSAIPWTVAYQAPMSMEFSKQE